MGISLKDIFKNDEERLIENKRKTSIRNMIIFLCALFVMIIVLLIIKFWSSADDVRREDIIKDITNVRNAILSRAEKMHEEEYPGVSLDNQGVTLNVNGVIEEYRYGYYILESGDIAELNLALNLPNEVYVVNYDTGDVINGTGIKYKGRRYHSYEDINAIAKGETPISDRTIIISSAADLNKIKQIPNGYFKLSANIDMSDYSEGDGWEPIQNFTGVFDGRGYTIANLKIDRPTQSFVGLFGDVKGTASITNLNLDNVNIKGGEYTGALAGNCSGVVTNVHVNNADVTGYTSSTGGLLGAFAVKKINNCTVRANVDGDRNVGGVIGTLYNGTVNRVSSEGNVTATDNAGGLIGLARIGDTTYVEESSAHVAVNGKNNIGGFVGAIEMTASRKLEIANSYAIGSVQTGESNMGGMIGQIYTMQGAPDIVLENLYAAVSVVNKGETSGGFIGYCNVGVATSLICPNCFWEKNLNPGEVLNDVGKTATGFEMNFVSKAPAEMRLMSTYKNWDFREIWKMVERESTPTLIWEENYIIEDRG